MNTRSEICKLRHYSVFAIIALFLLVSSVIPGFAQVITTDRILSYKMLKGQPQWEDQQRARIQGAIWQFHPDGTFVFNAPDLRSDLFPMQGTFTRRGDTVIFQGRSFSTIGMTGTAFAEIEGQIDLNSTPPVLTMTHAAGMSNSAVIYRQPFSSSASSSYRIKVTVQRLR